MDPAVIVGKPSSMVHLSFRRRCRNLVPAALAVLALGGCSPAHRSSDPPRTTSNTQARQDEPFSVHRSHPRTTTVSASGSDADVCGAVGSALATPMAVLDAPVL